MRGLDPRIHFFSKMMVGHVPGLNIKAGNDGGGQEEKILRYSRSPTRRQLLKASAAALPLAVVVAPASAQAAYPARPVKVVIPYPPAGGADTVGRLLFQKLSEMWGTQFVIDNRGGAGGTIAAAAVAKAERDGYTIMYDATAHSVNPSLYANLPYDTVKDFQPVFLGALITNLLVVNKSVEARNVADVIALAKATQGGLDWASSGNGTVQHLALEMFKHRADIKLNHIPYRGGGPALNDLIGGQVKFYFSNAAASIGHVQSGTLKCIAHTGRGRLAALPDVPAVAETLPGFEAYEWQGLFVPAGTPAEIVQKLNSGLNAVLRQADIAERLKQLNVEFRENTPEEFRGFVAAEMEKWGRVVREANIKLG
ncbi:MAG: Bug family tripartite tricarboxylate transporter substrate binding protein [Xanthobacteraceae bacterium]